MVRDNVQHSITARRIDTIDTKLESRVKSAEIELKEKSELGEVMENLDNDNVDVDTGMSSIDFNTRLTIEDISNILRIDEGVRFGVLPPTIGLTRQKKRLQISLKGMGRAEKVQIVSSERSNRNGGSFGERFAGLFKPRG